MIREFILHTQSYSYYAHIMLHTPHVIIIPSVDAEASLGPSLRELAAVHSSSAQIPQRQTRVQ